MNKIWIYKYEFWYIDLFDNTSLYPFQTESVHYITGPSYFREYKRFCLPACTITTQCDSTHLFSNNLPSATVEGSASKTVSVS